MIQEEVFGGLISLLSHKLATRYHHILGYLRDTSNFMCPFTKPFLPTNLLLLHPSSSEYTTTYLVLPTRNLGFTYQLSSPSPLRFLPCPFLVSHLRFLFLSKIFDVPQGLVLVSFLLRPHTSGWSPLLPQLQLPSLCPPLSQTCTSNTGSFPELHACTSSPACQGHLPGTHLIPYGTRHFPASHSDDFYLSE